MEQTELTIAQAVRHFDEHYFRPGGKPVFGVKDKRYFQCYNLIKDAQVGDVTFERVKGVLEEHAPGRYFFTEKIQIV